MRKSLIDSILCSQRPVAVLTDESTSLSRASCMVVYLRSTFNGEVGPVTFFLDCIELADTTADGIELALLNCLGSHGLNNEFLAEYFLGLGVDGASVMLGAKNGVAAKLKSRFPLLTSWHCFNHRLELSVGDAVKSCTEINHFNCFMDTLYATYSKLGLLKHRGNWLNALLILL